MFYDLEDPNQFIGDIAEVLADDGIFIAQLMCLQNMLNVKDVGNFAHEHLEYYSLASLDYLLNRHGLEIFDIGTNSVNGESYRLYIRLIGSNVKGRPGCHERLEAARKKETGLNRVEFFQEFYFEMERNKERVVRFVQSAVKSGKTVHAYGASTKGNVILQYYGLDNRWIEKAAERSTEKYGKYTVGTNIPIISEEDSRKINPDYYLVLPYAFLPEFMEREAEWRRGGGTFIVPLPVMRLV